MSKRKRTPEMESYVHVLRSEGWSARAIADLIGVSRTTVKRILYPAILEYERTYNAVRQRQGTCVDCGKQISSNASVPALRCSSCHGKKWARSRRVAGGPGDTT